MESIFLCRRWVVTPLFTLGKEQSSYLANPVGNQSFYSGSVSGMKLNFAIEKLLDPLGLASSQVAFRAFDPHDFTAAGNMEATFRAFMGFHFWHLDFPLPLLWLSFW
jgi:hypothetical protein